MLRAISAVLLFTLAALALSCAAAYVQTRFDAVLSAERLSRDAARTQSGAGTSDTGIVEMFPLPETGAVATDATDQSLKEQARDKDRIFGGVSLWLLWGLTAELCFALAFAVIVLLRSASASQPPEFRQGLGAWRMLGLGFLTILAIDSYVMLGARSVTGLMSTSALAVDIVLLFVVGAIAFYFSTVFAIPKKMLPSVPYGSTWR